jgi:signal transduction histidine kinase
MDRRILIQVTAPTVLIGFVLFATCLVSAWIVNRLQTNMTNILSKNVMNQESVHELEINVRRLRFHCFRYLVDPERTVLDPALRQEMAKVHRAFQKSLDQVRQSANTAEEQACIRQIEEGYALYLQEFQRLSAQAIFPRRSHRELADENPVHLVIDPCDRLLQLNRSTIDQTRQDSERVSRLLRLTLLLLGLGGPVSGLIIGFGMARGLSRSIHRLSVRVHDMAQQLEQDVASVSIVPDGDVRNLDRQLEHVVARVQDVAGRLQQHQREMIRAQQLAAVGQLAASVAHEVRNPLTSIKMLVEAALRTRSPRPFTAENLVIVHGEVARLEKTVQAFLDFARPPALQRARCDLRDIVEDALALIHSRAGQQGVECVVDGPTGAFGDFDRGQLRSVLVNLLLNALDAMPSGGRIEVRLGLSALDGGLVLSVRDTGKGIPEEGFAELFQPFVSTKPTGTGLGLCICRRIVEEHGGRIRAENVPDGGARFTVTLPPQSV